MKKKPVWVLGLIMGAFDVIYFSFLGQSTKKPRRLKWNISRPPFTITYITLESWKMIIILIVRKGVLIWTK
jgi:hypothetical protein